MRIVVINPHMSASYSGPTVLMNRLFGELAKNASFEITAVGPEIPHELIENITYVTLTTPDLRGIRGQLLWFLKSAAWLLKNHRLYDVVHFHGAYIFNLFGALAPIFRRKLVVILPLGANGDLRRDSKSNRVPVLKSVKRFIIRRVYRAFALSEDNATELRDAGVSQSKIVRINNPASDDFFTEPISSGKRKHDLVLVGKLGQGKRPDLAIDALGQLTEAGWDDATLTLIGPFENPKFEAEMHDLIEELNLDGSVTLAGFVRNVSEIMDRLPAAIFVLPSAQEGLPGAMTEAMARGMPVVVTDVGAMGEVVREADCGYIVAPNSDSISSAISEIWGNTEIWDKLASNAYLYARTYFSQEAVARKYAVGLE